MAMSGALPDYRDKRSLGHSTDLHPKFTNPCYIRQHFRQLSQGNRVLKSFGQPNRHSCESGNPGGLSYADIPVARMDGFPFSRE